MVPILKVTRQPPDNIDDYRQEFGYLGPALHGAVTRARSQSTTQAASTGGISSAACKDCVTHTRVISDLVVIVKSQMSSAGNLGISAGRGTIVMGGASSSAASSRTQTSAVANTAGNPTKYMFVTSRPSTPVQVFVTHKNESSDVIKKKFIRKQRLPLLKPLRSSN